MNPWDEPADKRKKWIRVFVAFLLLVILPSIMVVTTIQPTFRQCLPTEKQLDPARLLTHVSMLSENEHYHPLWF